MKHIKTINEYFSHTAEIDNFLSTLPDPINVLTIKEIEDIYSKIREYKDSHPQEDFKIRHAQTYWYRYMMILLKRYNDLQLGFIDPYNTRVFGNTVRKQKASEIDNFLSTLPEPIYVLTIKEIEDIYSKIREYKDSHPQEDFKIKIGTKWHKYITKLLKRYNDLQLGLNIDPYDYPYYYSRP